MKRIEKPSAMEVAATALADAIRTGSLAGRLPGTRVLAARLGVSAPTVAAALARLADDGVLVKSGERRAYRVAGRGNSRAKASSHGKIRNRLLILTHADIGQLVEFSRRLLEKLRDVMAGKGWTVDHQVVDFLHVKRPRRAWDRLIGIDPHTSVIALYGRGPLAEWAVRRKVRILFLGGNADGLPVPVLAVNSAQMAAAALARLSALGHTRMVIPLCDRAEPFKVAMRAVTREAVEATGQTYVPSYHNPESDYLEPDVTLRIMQSLFSKVPPTALVLLDWKEFVTVHSYLARIRLLVPEDVSIILLSESMESNWFHPELSRFRFPFQKILRALVRWLHGSWNGEDWIRMQPDFVTGATIAPVRGK